MPKKSVNNSENASPSRIQRGDFGTSLSTIMSRFPGEPGNLYLFGPFPVDSSSTLFQTLDLVSKFLAQHQMASSTSNNGSSHIIATATYYLPTITEFSQSQVDRQAAGLRSNTNRESTAGVARLVENHSVALRTALADRPADPISIFCNEFLQNIHRLQFPATNNNDSSSATHSKSIPGGRYRTKTVRAGQTYFTPHERIPDELRRLWTSLRQLQQQVQQKPPNSPSRTFYAIALAVTAMYGILDIHPFEDGNGRVARIFSNAVLKHYLGLPFSITLTATQQHRQEYVSAVKNANVSIRDNGTTDIGSLRPIIQIFLERIVHAVVQLQSLLTQKAQSVRDEDEARIARRIREQAAQGQCVICLDNNPNIATLCCGQAVHLNCIAEWLANGSTCVSCRQPLPRLNVQQRRNGQEEEAPRDFRDYDRFHNEMQAMHRAIQQAIALQNQADGVEDDTETTVAVVQGRHNQMEETEFADDETTHTTEVVQNVPPECLHCRNRAAVDCGNNMCGRCCENRGQSECARHGTNMDTMSTTSSVEDANEDTTDDTTVHAPPEPDSDTSSTRPSTNIGTTIQYCHYCNNRAAQDCDHELCGRCCVIQGFSYSCDRHGG